MTYDHGIGIELFVNDLFDWVCWTGMLLVSWNAALVGCLSRANRRRLFGLSFHFFFCHFLP
jgi:hypothetical protein